MLRAHQLLIATHGVPARLSLAGMRLQLLLVPVDHTQCCAAHLRREKGNRRGFPGFPLA